MLLVKDFGTKKYLKLSVKKSINSAVRNTNNTKSFLFTLVEYLYKNLKNKEDLNEEFKGQLLMKTRGENFKIFDFINSKVLTYTSNKKEFNEIIKTFKCFKRIHNVPLISYNYSNQTYIEKLINFMEVDKLNIDKKMRLFSNLWMRVYLWEKKIIKRLEI